MGGVVDFAKAVYKPIFGGLISLVDKPKKPKLPALSAPPTEDKLAAGKAAQAAALKKKKAAEAAVGYEDTNLTSPTGLLGVPSMYQANKTLTGT